METLGNGKNYKKTPDKYTCAFCDYTTSYKGNLKSHMLTRKHAKLSAGNDVSINFYKKRKRTYKCSNCEKKFQTRSGRWKHEKKCSIVVEGLQLKLEEANEKIGELKTTIKNIKLESANKRIGGTLTQNIQTQNNINVYLNEDCKNAIPIMDFIRSLTFQLSDINPHCYASSIQSLSNVFIESLQKLDDTKRPIHCSDQKRMKFYVKDASGWEKDDNQKVDNAIEFANMRHQGAWHKYAQQQGLATKDKDDYYLQMNVEMGSWSDDPTKHINKIKRDIGKNTLLKKAIKKGIEKN